MRAGRVSRTPAEAQVQCLQALDDALAGLPGWVHASWPASLGLPIPAASGARAAGLFHWPAALGLEVPTAASFELPAHRLAVLPPPLLCRVLRARALLRRRPALRRCVDTRLLARLAGWLHPAVLDAVMRDSVEGLHLDLDGLPLLPATRSEGLADLLAWEGFCLFHRDRVWSDPMLLRLVRLGFPLAQLPAPGLKARPGARAGSVWVLQRLARFVPEAPWLCG